MKPIIAILFLLLCLISGLDAACALANPSFEVPGTGAGVFRGWEQFGQFGSSSNAVHGFSAAALYGQNNGSINVSGYWQELFSSPNEQWKINGYVLIPASNPLQGGNQALVNIEWRSASGGMISYQSFNVADANTQAGQYIRFERVSYPAPAGTVAMRLVVGVLQGAQDPIPTAIFDQITCYSQNYPTIDDVQWNDFPGGRSIDWSGRTWRVKGPGHYGPGPNNFSDSAASVWVDVEDRLHMTIRQIDSAWNSTEVVLVDTLGYGDYIFTTFGAVNQIADNAVLGLFLWQYSTCWDAADAWWNPYNEFDIEYSRWGNPGNQFGQYVAQPWDWPGNIFRYDAAFAASEITSHAIRWLPNRVEGRAWRGGPADEASSAQISSWIYTGPHIPRPEQPRVHINLWYFGSPPPSTQEVVLPAFTFVPQGGGLDSNDDLSQPPAIALAQNYPNPFNPATSISFTLDQDAMVKLDIFDLRGRLLHSLVDEFKPTGTHTVEWNAGSLPSGIYFCRLQSGSRTATRKMILMK